MTDVKGVSAYYVVAPSTQQVLTIERRRSGRKMK